MKVVSLYDKTLVYGFNRKCRKPCSKLSASYGFPLIKKIKENETQIFLLFSSDIKVVSENIPYTFLRLVLKPFFKTVLQLLA